MRLSIKIEDEPQGGLNGPFIGDPEVVTVAEITDAELDWAALVGILRAIAESLDDPPPPRPTITFAEQP